MRQDIHTILLPPCPPPVRIRRRLPSYWSLRMLLSPRCSIAPPRSLRMISTKRSTSARIGMINTRSPGERRSQPLVRCRFKLNQIEAGARAVQTLSHPGPLGRKGSHRGGGPSPCCALTVPSHPPLDRLVPVPLSPVPRPFLLFRPPASSNSPTLARNRREPLVHGFFLLPAALYMKSKSMKSPPACAGAYRRG